MTYPADYPQQREREPHMPVLLTSETGQWLTRQVRNLMDVLAKTKTGEFSGSMFEAELLSWMVLNFASDALPHDEGELTRLLGLWHEGRIPGRNGQGASRIVGQWTPARDSVPDVSYSDSFERAV